MRNLCWFICIVALFITSFASAEDKPKCEVYVQQSGEYRITVKNTRWSVSPSDAEDGPVYLWFSKSSLSSVAPDMIAANISTPGAIMQDEVETKQIGENVIITLTFDAEQIVRVPSPLVRRHHKSKPYYFFRWQKLIDEPMHQQIVDLSKSSGEVLITIEDSETGAILRQARQRLQGFVPAMTKAEHEFRRIASAEPPGSCTRF